MAETPQSWQDLVDKLQNIARLTMQEMTQMRQSTEETIRLVSKDWLQLNPSQQDETVLFISAATALYRHYTQRLDTLEPPTPNQELEADTAHTFMQAFISHYAENRQSQILEEAYCLLKPTSQAHCSRQIWPLHLAVCLSKHQPEAIRVLTKMLQANAQNRLETTNTQIKAAICAIQQKYTVQPEK